MRGGDAPHFLGQDESSRLMSNSVTGVRYDLIHFIFNMQFELLEALLLKFVLTRNMWLGFDLLYLVFQLRMLLG